MIVCICYVMQDQILKKYFSNFYSRENLQDKMSKWILFTISFHIIVKPWSKSKSKALSQHTPRSNKSSPKKEKRRIWTLGWQSIIIASRAHNLCKSSQSLTLSPVKLVVLFHRIGWTQRFVRTRTLTWALQHFYTLQWEKNSLMFQS